MALDENHNYLDDFVTVKCSTLEHNIGNLVLVVLLWIAKRIILYSSKISISISFSAAKTTAIPLRANVDAGKRLQFNNSNKSVSGKLTFVLPSSSFQVTVRLPFLLAITFKTLGRDIDASKGVWLDILSESGVMGHVFESTSI